MGLYYRPMILPSDPDGLDHYFAHSEIALPMQLYLYDYESGENIFSWRPIEDQWWITGFNPEYKDEEADAKNQVMIGSVQFPNGEFNEFFNSLSVDELDALWSKPEIRDVIEACLRSPGGLYEWHLVSITTQFK